MALLRKQMKSCDRGPQIQITAGVVVCRTDAQRTSEEPHGRVLRVPEDPWGLPSLRLKELRQIRVGNDLMGFILEAVVMLYCVGGVAALEHPAAPVSESSVSIWRTPILALLSSLPGIDHVSLAQGLWGAKSPKPTSFLVVNICQCTRDETSIAKLANCPGVTKGYLYRKGSSWRLVHSSFERVS